MRVGSYVLVAILALCALAPEGAGGYEKVYEKVRPSIVGVRASIARLM